MTTSAQRILLVDDDDSWLELSRIDLTMRGYAVLVCHSVAEAITILQQTEVDVVITDLNMPGGSGLVLCEWIASHRSATSVIVATGFGDLEAAVVALRAGARDFLSKPVELDVLAASVGRVVAERSVAADGERPSDVILEESPVAASAEMRAVLDLVRRVAPTDASVLITGESGTGKEEIARSLHRASRRRAGAFIPVNCAAVAESLLESELFGHVRGAFTDARKDEPGLFVSANGGTIFLDEIGDMAPCIQPKLLRVLQERTVRPVGSNRERPTDARVIAATNHDLETSVSGGEFREDLYYRINVVHIRVPPLRARRDDIMPLAQRFRRMFAATSGKNVSGIHAEAEARLVAHAWPGNVRELQNCIERAVALTRSTEISVEDLPPCLRSGTVDSVTAREEIVPLHQLERSHIRRVLDAAKGNKSAAARALGIDRKRLYRMLVKLG